MTKKKTESGLSELAGVIVSAAPELEEIVSEVCDLYDAPPHLHGTPEHTADEKKLESLAQQLGSVGYPDSVKAQLIELFDRCRVSLTHGA